jgi:serine/threonine protein kinase/Tfp pilus assembly protein PilF
MAHKFELMQQKLIGGRYQVVRHLGGGGYGQTYLAEDTQQSNAATCVLKQLQPQVSDPQHLKIARRLFETEAKVLRQLGSHSQIPQLLDYFEEDQEFYLVQEFVDGIELSEELAIGRRLPEDQVINLLKEILEILVFVHQQNVIHRDVNPRNILRRHSDRQLVLIDFGAVKQISTQIMPQGQTVVTVAIGTPGFFPSEQANGKPKFNSDVFAVGMMGIQALTGLDPARNRLPEDPTSGEIAWQSQTQVSPKLARIIDRMVRYDFRVRYQSAASALEDLRSLGSSTILSPTVALPIPTQIAPGRSLRVPHFPKLLAGGVLLSTLALLAALQATRSQPTTPGVATSGFATAVQTAGLLAQAEADRTTGAYESALDAYDRALVNSPELATAHWGRCYALNSLQQYEQAIEACDRAIQLQPDYAEAWWSQGYALQGLQRPQAALAAYDKALEINPTYAEAWNNRGTALSSLEQYEEALTAYDKALTINSSFAEAWNNRGAALNWLERYEDALAAYDKALEINPDYAEAWNNRGVVLASLQRYEEAAVAYEEALERNPNYAEAQTNQERLRGRSATPQQSAQQSRNDKADREDRSRGQERSRNNDRGNKND